ncbi:MAG: hypothetical protein KKF30_17195 [Proteobacteria bacterium]|nr:hypothetical protein [Pseudomonadota bacterium]MBU4469116.1 hypothetical protein [Pseudomonadota bacterium]MCG2752147.1 hypothetical protein [Desulfobacteraceae bacterium]
MKKKYHLKTSCPQCGCSFLSVLTPEEIKEKYGDMPNVEMECSECMNQYHAEMKTVCPEWDQECRLGKA